MNKLVWFFLLFIGLGGSFLPHVLQAQSSFFQEESFNFENELVSGFSEDGRIKILLLTLVPVGMTETASQEILKALYQNLSNTNHFTLVGPSEWNAQVRSRNPSLADCHDIACGIDIGKRLNSDMVLVGRIQVQTILNDLSEEQEGMVLSLRMVDVTTNINIFDDEIRFTDESMNDALFRLAVRISESTQLRGHVLSVKKKEITLDLGKAHGLKIGHQIVVYKQTSLTSEIDGQPLGLSQANIALAQIHRLNDNSSEALILQKFEDIQTGYLIKTYINFSKQIRLVAEIRRELDSMKRLTPIIRPLKLMPELLESQDSGKERWAAKLELAKFNKKRWMYITFGSGIATLIMFNNKFTPFSEDLNRLLPLIAAGGTVYSGYRLIQYRNEVNALMAQGRVKGFLSQIDYHWEVSPQSVQVTLRFQY